MSKNGIKKALRPLFKELWANYEFSNLEIYERFPPRKTGRKFLDGKAVSAFQKLCDFFKKNDEKNNDFRSKTLKMFKKIQSPKMVSKRLYDHYLRSYEQIKNFQI